MLEELKEKVFKANLDLVKQNLVIFTWGNVSGIDRENGLVVIKPSGVDYDVMKASDMVVVDLKTGEVVDGDLNPSSDTPTHVVLYKEFAVKDGAAINGIIHTHSSYAVSWAQALKPVPLFGTTHADHIQTEVPCTPYLSEVAVKNDYERETGNLIVSHFRSLSLNPAEVNMVLVGGHGPFCWGATADKAVYNAAVLEEVSKMALNTLMIEPRATPLPAYIIDKHYQRKHGPNAYYGQAKK